jgi:PAS domain S-box-containing protein
MTHKQTFETNKNAVANNLLRRILEYTPIPIAVSNNNGVIIFRNDRFNTIFGYTDTDVITKEEWGKKVYPDAHCREKALKQWDEYVLRAAQTGSDIKPDIYHITCKDAIVRDFIISGVMLDDYELTTFVDITDRTKAESALKESEKKYSSLFNTMLEGFALHEIICDANDKPVNYAFLDINPAFEQLTGLKKDTIIGKTVLEVMPDTEPVWIEKYGNVALTGVPVSFENYSRALQRYYHVVAFSPQKKYFAVIFNDITEQKHTEQLIADEKERLAVTLRSIGDGVITTDTHGNITNMNNVAEELTGWKLHEAQGMPLSTVFNIINETTRKACENPVTKTLATGMVVKLANHTLLISRNGVERIIADSGAPIIDNNHKIIGVVLVFRDITEQQKLLETAQRTDKLESIGVLAGGIAHDFNNLLSGIYGYIGMAQESCEPDSKTAVYLGKAIKTFSRAKGLTQQLLTFAKGGAPSLTTGSIADKLKESTMFALSGSNAGCSFRIAHDLWLCDFDVNMMGQVIDNIILNAVQAMPEGGTITVTAENTDIIDSKQPVLKNGKYVHIAIADTGIGIPANIMSRIFDPFFTTKQKGSGLGLATVYSIITKHDGTISVESMPDKGTTFHIHLPVSGHEQTE